MSEVVDDSDVDEVEPAVDDPSLDWSPLVYRTARAGQGLLLLALLVIVGLGFGRLGPLAVIGRGVHRGLIELDVIEPAPPAVTTPPATTTPITTTTAPPTTTTTTTTPPTTTVPPPDFDPLNGLYGSYPTAPKADSSEGATGEVVLYLEAVLAQHAGQALAVDDVFGPDTTAAVLNLQAFFALPQTGLVDAATWRVVDLLASQPTA